MRTKYEYVVYPFYPDRIVSKDITFATEMVLINRTTIKTKEVLQFLEWVYSSQENYDLLMYGIEGEDYELIGDKVKMISDYNGCFYFSIFQNLDYMRNPYSIPFDMVELYREAQEKSSYKRILWYGFYEIQNMDLYTQRWKEISDQNSSIFFGLFNLNISEFRQKYKDLNIDAEIYAMQKDWENWKARYKNQYKGLL